MIFTLTIDLDPLRCYRQLYGLPAAEPADGVAARATERFCNLAGELGISGTLFAVGDTLSQPEVRQQLTAAAAAGHEIACHSHDHAYDLFEWPRERIVADLAQSLRVIEQACGARPRGFRAPGYLLGRHLLGVLEELGLDYDSSLLPSPAYRAVKGAARLLLGLAGRRTAARRGDPREAWAPSQPFHPHPQEPWRRGRSRLLEMPIGTVLGLPLTGSLLALAGPARAELLARLARGPDFLCLELHGVDLLDIESDGLDQALGLQPDLRLPWERKYEAILIFCRSLLNGYEALTMARAAEHYS